MDPPSLSSLSSSSNGQSSTVKPFKSLLRRSRSLPQDEFAAAVEKLRRLERADSGASGNSARYVNDRVSTVYHGTSVPGACRKKKNVPRPHPSFLSFSITLFHASHCTDAYVTIDQSPAEQLRLSENFELGAKLYLAHYSSLACPISEVMLTLPVRKRN